MSDFTAHHIRFEAEPLTPLVLPAYAGPGIRAALFDALRHHFCPAPDSEARDAAHKAFCPACWLMATEKPEGDRGRDVPRPYAIEPPMDNERMGRWGEDKASHYYQPGERFQFGLTLFAQAMNLFPYLVIAMPLVGQGGLGVPLRENGRREGEKRRGQFKLCRVEAINPLTGEIQPVMGEGQTTVRMPDMPATDRDVAQLAAAMARQLPEIGQVQLGFRTPTRIVEGERLVRQPHLGPLFRRLLERLDALRGEYAGLPPTPDREALTALADAVRLADDRTRWVEVKSESRRLGRPTWVSGYVGQATYEAPRSAWERLLPYLLWGQATHVGKNATKGNGWYKCEKANERESE